MCLFPHPVSTVQGGSIVRMSLIPFRCRFYYTRNVVTPFWFCSRRSRTRSPRTERLVPNIMILGNFVWTTGKLQSFKASELFSFFASSLDRRRTMTPPFLSWAILCTRIPFLSGLYVRAKYYIWSPTPGGSLIFTIFTAGALRASHRRRMRSHRSWSVAGTSLLCLLRLVACSAYVIGTGTTGPATTVFSNLEILADSTRLVFYFPISFFGLRYLEMFAAKDI